MDNKQIIHIATEVITIIGLTIYFSRQNKILRESIEVLTNNYNEQTEIIKKHEDMINNLLETVQKLILQQQQIKQQMSMIQSQNHQVIQQQPPIMQPQNPQVIQHQPPIMQPQNPSAMQQQPPMMQPQNHPDAQQSSMQSQKPQVIQQPPMVQPKVRFEEPPQQFLAFQFMHKPLSPQNSHKVEEIIEEDEEYENIDEEDKKIVEEELLDDELAEELKELENDD